MKATVKTSKEELNMERSEIEDLLRDLKCDLLNRLERVESRLTLPRLRKAYNVW